ncbi:hypothetical protein QNI19_14480 [Cytophagaceae bacterium DM2B3-1]|uniref:Phage tail collar domain-containing protein n=1 Tax=Xanthocytophaga flava TaxID=3048013 RepID=A0ABT7CK82_9BACT|nr:hypothetical protein [Xanthocytophaga flavus]MDJ1494147.1 hypothetical protein [Xanthocytophaga flavus]
MKEIFADDGGRPLYNEDVTLLQTELSEVMTSQVKAFGSNMIVVGCELTAAVTPGNYNIASGLVYLDGRFMRVEAVADVTLPVYVVPSTVEDTSRTYKTGAVKVAVKDYKAEIVTALPASPPYITINASRSEYYANFVRNASVPVGFIGFIDDETIITTYFDTVTLLGSGPWLGWSMLANTYGRFPVGYDPTSATIPANQTGLTRNYGKPGNTGGKDNVAMTVAEMPIHNHKVSNNSNSDSGSGRLAVGGDGSEGIAPSTDNAGSGQAHENRPPYIVLAFVKKIA